MIGERVKQRRLELGLTQDELAKRMGYKSKSTINKIEKDINDVSQSKMVELARALSCDVSYFIYGNEETPEEAQQRRLMIYASLITKKYAKLTEQNKKIVDNLVDSLLKSQGGGSDEG